MLEQYSTLQYLKSELMIYSSSSANDQRFYKISSKLLNHDESFSSFILWKNASTSPSHILGAYLDTLIAFKNDI